MSHTKEMTAKDAKNNFGALLENAQRSPVGITKNGRKVAVLISSIDYERFEELEDLLWAEKAIRSSKAGFLSSKKSDALLNEILTNALD